jgi:hypothetical protein
MQKPFAAEEMKNLVHNKSYDTGGKSYALAIDIPLRAVEFDREICLDAKVYGLNATISSNNMGVQFLSISNIISGHRMITPRYDERDGVASSEDALNLVDTAANIANQHDDIVDTEALTRILRMS